MPSKATRYSISFKKEAVLNYLQFKISSPNASMNHFLTTFNYHFAVSCFYQWLRIFKDELMTQHQLPINAVENKFGSTANDLTLSQKQKIILEVANLTEEQLGEYCRVNGLYASDIADWKLEIEQGLMLLSSNGNNVISEKELRKGDYAKLRRIRELEEKLRRKEKSIDRRE